MTPNITTTRKPLSYGTLKCILKHMDANQRIQLSRRSWEIHQIDKQVALKIKKLTFDEMRIDINETSYQLGIVREFLDPSRRKKGNETYYEKYGHTYDVDPWGFEICDREGNLEDAGVEHQQLKEIINSLDQQLSDLKFEAEICRSENVKLEIRDKIEAVEMELLPYRLKIERNLEIPYNHFIQLMISQPRGMNILEKTDYGSGKTLFDSFDYLTHTIFGGRNHRQLCHVKTMKAVNLRCLDPKIWSSNNLRSCKFRVENLEIPDVNPEKYLRLIEPLLDATSFPLGSLEISEPFSDYSNPILCTARLLIFNGSECGSELLDFLYRRLKNRRVHVASTMANEELIQEVIEYWMEYGKEQGTHYSFDGWREQIAIDNFLNKIAQMTGATVENVVESAKSNHSISVLLPVNNSLCQLKVYYKTDETKSDLFKRVFHLKVQMNKEPPNFSGKN